LPRGTQLSLLLFGYPRVLASERAYKKFLNQARVPYDPNLARVVAHSSQVTHFVNKNFEESATQLDGDPQVVNLPFKCPEGDVPSDPMIWVNWLIEKYVRYKNTQHKQFINIMIVRLNSVASYAMECQDQEKVALSDSESESEEEGGNNDGDGDGNSMAS
jgi:hypothetical protein